jgi:hypothetical protein
MHGLARNHKGKEEKRQKRRTVKRKERTGGE